MDAPTQEQASGSGRPSKQRLRVQRARQKQQQQKQRQQEKQSDEQVVHAAGSAAGSESEGDGEGSDDTRLPVLEVKVSTIPNAGDGLFLASRFVPAGVVLLAEEAVAIRRPAAKKIMNLPEWRGLQPVIQASGDRFLDIRQLTLYKSNHTESSSPKCNAFCSQIGPAKLTLTARRDIWQGEEILWEYSRTMREDAFELDP